MAPSYKQCLEVLGLESNASKADIKAAFKKLALQFHPDKSATHDTTPEFQKIKEAYDFLMQYDGSSETSSDPLMDAMWSQVFDTLLSQMTKSMKDFNKKCRKDRSSSHNKKLSTSERERKHHRTRSPSSASDDLDEKSVDTNASANANANACIDITMRVTLDDLYHAKVKKLLVKVKGHNQEEKQQELYISLFSHKKLYTFKNKGDYIHNGDGVDGAPTRGNINVHLEVDKHDLVSRDQILCQYDLYIDWDITLHDYYCRKYLAIPYFGEVLELENLYPGIKCKVFKGKGLPYFDEKNEEDTRGDLYVYFNLLLPAGFKNEIGDTYEETVPPDVKQVLAKHFVLC